MTDSHPDWQSPAGFPSPTGSRDCVKLSRLGDVCDSRKQSWAFIKQRTFFSEHFLLSQPLAIGPQPAYCLLWGSPGPGTLLRRGPSCLPHGAYLRPHTESGKERRSWKSPERLLPWKRDDRAWGGGWLWPWLRSHADRLTDTLPVS